MTKRMAALFLSLLLPALAFSSDYREYRLRSIDWIISGRTKQEAVIIASSIAGDESWPNIEALELWLRAVEKRLLSTRLFESVSASYVTAEEAELSIASVDISIEIVDSRNTILLPRPKYDPNEGLLLGLGLRDYNFLGSMQTLKMDLGFMAEGLGQPDQPPERVFWNTEAIVGGALEAIRWNVSLVQDLSVDRNLSSQSGTIASLRVDIPAGFLTLSTLVGQDFYLNHDMERFYLMDDAGVLADAWYGASQFTLSASAPVFGDGVYGQEVRYTAAAGYSTGGKVGAAEPWPGFAVMDQSVKAATVDWIGNFKQGYSFAAINDFILDLKSNDWLIDFKVEGIVHYIPYRWLGVSARLYAIHRAYDYAFEDGWLFRGVLDKELSVRSLCASSIDIHARVLSVLPSLWFNDERLSVFDFELQLGLFVDAGIGVGLGGGPLHLDGDYVVCAGMDILIFPLAFKSAFLRVSLGRDMGDPSRTIEPYLGLDLHY